MPLNHCPFMILAFWLRFQKWEGFTTIPTSGAEPLESKQIQSFAQSPVWVPLLICPLSLIWPGTLSSPHASLHNQGSSWGWWSEKPMVGGNACSPLWTYPQPFGFSPQVRQPHLISHRKQRRSAFHFHSAKPSYMLAPGLDCQRSSVRISRRNLTTYKVYC